MKVLLDENIPHNLRQFLREHDVATVTYCGWGGLKNGELLKAAQGAGFEVFVTGDRELEFQQNLAEFSLAVIALSDNHWPIISRYIPEITASIKSATPGALRRVDCGTFNRAQGRGR